VGDLNGCPAGFRQDWKFRVELLATDRFYSCNLVCDSCLATKSGRLSYKKLTLSSPWMRTIGILPKAGPSSEMAKVAGYEEDLLFWDPAHCWAMGGGRNLNATAILEYADLYKTGNKERRLGLTYADFKAWCCHRKVYPSIKKFSLAHSTFCGGILLCIPSEIFLCIMDLISRQRETAGQGQRLA